MRRKICIVTGTRAEYGLLYWLMKEVQDDLELELQLIVTGMHLSPEFGLTYKQIEKDGFHIDEKVEMIMSSDTPVGISKSIGLGVIGFADSLDRLKPDILVVLGDRYEILSAAQAAMLARIPIAHIHGGELTEGAIDDSIRHALTKMSHIHFPTTNEYRNRVIQMGEQPERVYNFGSPGIDYIKKTKLLTIEEIEYSLDINLRKLNFLVTYHPETNTSSNTEIQINEITSALNKYPNATIVITKSNSDTEGRIINHLFEEYAKTDPERIKLFDSLGQKMYLSVLSHFDAVIGNSSSGIIEAPVFKKPTVNVGMRQHGRKKAMSIVDCECESTSIVAGIDKVTSQVFQETLKDTISIYGTGNTSKQIKEVLSKVNLKEIVVKKFHDLDYKG